MSPTSILKKYSKAGFIKRGGVERIRDLLNFIQDKLDGYNKFMDG